MCLFSRRKGAAVALKYMYDVLEHMVSFNHRTAQKMLTKLGRDEVLMAPHMHLRYSIPQVSNTNNFS